jgi:CheY-like chemotaxis protein
VDLFRVSAQKIDVVLLDMTLPGLSGREVLGELRRIQPDVHVVITSAYTRDSVLTQIGEQQLVFYSKAISFE